MSFVRLLLDTAVLGEVCHPRKYVEVRSLDRLDELTRELTYVPTATSTWRAWNTQPGFCRAVSIGAPLLVGAKLRLRLIVAGRRLTVATPDAAPPSRC